MAKKLLLIAPIFFGYYKDIIEEARMQGYEVNYLCDSPTNSNFFKALNRVDKKITNYLSTRYFRSKVLPKIKNKTYDNVFMIAGMTFSFSPKTISVLRSLNKKAIFSLYQWDSEKNLPYVDNIHKYFDRIFTFDREDAQNKSSLYKFLPLFYNSTYKHIGEKNVNTFDYDCMYVGTAHPKKYHDINEMAQKLKPIYPRQFIYHYMPSRLKFIYHKFFAPEYRKAKYSDFKTQKLSLDTLKNVITRSRCILDAPQEGQNGLTIRTIECLAAKRKLITTNNDIVNYDFYRPENIYVYKGQFDFKNVFFKKEYHDINNNIYRKYSLNNWLKKILN